MRCTFYETVSSGRSVGYHTIFRLLSGSTYSISDTFSLGVQLPLHPRKDTTDSLSLRPWDDCALSQGLGFLHAPRLKFSDNHRVTAMPDVTIEAKREMLEGSVPDLAGLAFLTVFASMPP